MRKNQMSLATWLFNPFERIAGAQAVAIGAVMAVSMSALALVAEAHFPGAIDFRFGVIQPLPQLLLQNAIAIMDVTLCFYFGSVIAARRRLRLVDFLGTVAVARLPYFLLTAGFALRNTLFGPLVIDEVAARAGNFSVGFWITTLLVIAGLIWFMMLNFSALRVSSGLKGGKLWAVYVIGLIAAEALSVMLRF